MHGQQNTHKKVNVSSACRHQTCWRWSKWH